MNTTSVMNMRIAPAARKVLESWSCAPELKGHVPTIVWMGDSEGRHWGWSVGTYKREDIPSTGFVMVDGVEFVIEEALRARLSGKVLDYIDGYFVVR